MLATFCLRLACGMAAALLLLPSGLIHPRFFRVQFLTVLGLIAVAAMAVHGVAGTWLWIALSGAAGCAFIGSIAWSLDEAPGGQVAIVLTVIATAGALVVFSLTLSRPTPTEDTFQAESASGFPLLLGDELASAAVLGAATTAMLMGHSYLVAPTMSLSPLLRLVAALLLATVVRMALAGVGLWSWSADHALGNLEDETVLWLPLRWGLGFVAPLILGWMAWQTTRIRSTQSATGILYVVVIFCFLGELTSQLLLRNTGFVL